MNWRSVGICAFYPVYACLAEKGAFVKSVLMPAYGTVSCITFDGFTVHISQVYLLQ